MRNVSMKALLPALLVMAGGARAALTIPGADGSDGVLTLTQSTVIDLSKAVPGTWNAANGANAGKGVYDADKWAVVYKYSSVDLSPGVTVTFKNHPSGAPVVWLVSGNVNLGNSSAVSVNGSNANGGNDMDKPAEPGPGGFRGGASGSTYTLRGPGFGPGGSNYAASYGTEGASPAGPVYGNPQILPLIGGSGGAGVVSSQSGGAGGGAILIAATGTVSLGSAAVIQAIGGSSQYGGSGGAIRIVADTYLAPSFNSCYAPGGPSAGNGRIRIEANTVTMPPTVPAASVAPPAAIPVIFPPSQPKLVITTIDGQATSADPQGAFAPNNPTVVNIAKTTATHVVVSATNVPAGWNVAVRSAPKNGDEVIATAAKVSGTDASSTWAADVVLPLGYNALQVRAVKP
jgi:hypothetical protein